jgi:hypothetical protein
MKSELDALLLAARNGGVADVLTYLRALGCDQAVLTKTAARLYGQRDGEKFRTLVLAKKKYIQLRTHTPKAHCIELIKREFSLSEQDADYIADGRNHKVTAAATALIKQEAESSSSNN